MNLYSKSELGNLAKEHGFIRDNLEKVIRLCDVLRHFNYNPLLRESLALKGGTAINLAIFNLPRLSVDIDLDFTKECSREEMIACREQLNNEILNYMYSQGYTLNPKSKNPHSLDSWVFYYQNAGGNRDNLKVEINYSMRHHILSLIDTNISIAFLPSFKIRALSPLELFGSKIKALIERTAARDLFDVYNMITTRIFSEQEMNPLRKIVLFYLAVGGSYSPKVKYTFNSIDRLHFLEIRTQLLPVLRKKVYRRFQCTNLFP